MMFDVETSVFLAAFLGSAFGLPVGFLLINLIQLIKSKADNKRDEWSERLEWAMTQRGARVVDETQIANNWVRTVDLSSLKTLSDSTEEIPFDCHVPPFVTQVTGQYPQPPMSAQSNEEASENHVLFVMQIRSKLGLPPL